MAQRHWPSLQAHCFFADQAQVRGLLQLYVVYHEMSFSLVHHKEHFGSERCTIAGYINVVLTREDVNARL